MAALLRTQIYTLTRVTLFMLVESRRYCHMFYGHRFYGYRFNRFSFIEEQDSGHGVILPMVEREAVTPQ